MTYGFHNSNNTIKFYIKDGRPEFRPFCPNKDNTHFKVRKDASVHSKQSKHGNKTVKEYRYQ